MINYEKMKISFVTEIRIFNTWYIKMIEKLVQECN